MRLLLDESVPSRLRRALTNHEVRTVVEMGWSGVKNGKLLNLAASAFEVTGLRLGPVRYLIAAAAKPPLAVAGEMDPS